jgi:hypothetical protein
MQVIVADMKDKEDLSKMEILPPPEAMLDRFVIRQKLILKQYFNKMYKSLSYRREQATRCVIGKKEYCPGEILFR